MVVIMKRGFTPEQMEEAVRVMEAGGVKVMVSKGAETTILGAEGNAEGIDREKLSLLPGVERVMRVTEPYKKANRKYHPEDTVLDLGNGTLVGGEKLAVIAGPCAVESEALFLADDLEYGEPIPCDSDLADRLSAAEEEGNTALVELTQPGDIDNLLEFGGMSRLPIMLHTDRPLLLDEALRRFPGRLLVDSLCEIERPLLEDLAAQYGGILF